MPPSWLVRDASVADAFERRAARAVDLVEGSINGEALQFAAGLYRAQARVATALAGVTLTGTLAPDLDAFRGRLDPILRHAIDRGPSGLATEATALRRAGADAMTERLIAWWRGPRTGRTDYLARALLRPYAESLAAAGVIPEPASTGISPAGACQRCGGPAWIGWRRSGAGDEAPSRYLGCGVCGSERTVDRIGCPACGQTEPTQLAVFQTERYPAARLEACEACQRYVKSIDLTHDGRAIPEIDDLCSLSLDLWAAEQGYERLEPSLAGV